MGGRVGFQLGFLEDGPKVDGNEGVLVLGGDSVIEGGEVNLAVGTIAGIADGLTDGRNDVGRWVGAKDGVAVTDWEGAFGVGFQVVEADGYPLGSFEVKAKVGVFVGVFVIGLDVTLLEGLSDEDVDGCRVDGIPLGNSEGKVEVGMFVIGLEVTFLEGLSDEEGDGRKVDGIPLGNSEGKVEAGMFVIGLEVTFLDGFSDEDLDGFKVDGILLGNFEGKVEVGECVRVGLEVVFVDGLECGNVDGL